MQFKCNFWNTATMAVVVWYLWKAVITRFTHVFYKGYEAKSRIFFCKEKGNSFLPSVEQATHWGATSLVTPLFLAYSLFVERNSWITLSLLSQFICGHHPPVSSTRHWAFFFRAPSSAASVLWVLLFHHRWPYPFTDTPLTISANRYAFLTMPLPYDMVRGDLEGFV